MKNLLVVMLLCLGFASAPAQEVYNSSGKQNYHKKGSKKGYDPAKLILGGGIDLNFGGGYVVAGLSPIVGYRFLPFLSAGVGFGYQYFQQPDLIFSTPYVTYYDKGNLIYPNAWAKATVYRNIYVCAAFEYDIMKLKVPHPNGNGDMGTVKVNLNTQAVLIGAGIRQPISGRVSLFAEIQHELLQQDYSPYYGQPLIFHLGVAAGL